MILHTPINLPFADDLRFHTLDQLANFNEDLLYVKVINIPEKLRYSINKYLETKNIGHLMPVLSFKRKNTTAGYQFSHIDWSAKHGIINCSVVIPVAGCKNAGQIWYGGNYTFRGEQQTDPSGRGVIDVGRVVWNEPGLVLESAEIHESPQLVRTNLPHNAFSNGDEYRVTVTIRFYGNDDFETLLGKFTS